LKVAKQEGRVRRLTEFSHGAGCGCKLGLDVLTDVLAAPAVREHELDAEREVILEELALSEDTPDDKVHTLLSEALFPGHPLGREVLGDAETVEAMTRDDVLGFFSERYRPANVVVTAAGQLEHDDVVAGVEAFLADAGSDVSPARIAPGAGVVAQVVEHRDTEQAHLALGWRAFPAADPDRYALAVANQVLGGGMASRLFQEVREERGMAYSVWSSSSLYSDAGCLVAYAGTSPGKVRDVLKVVDDVIAALAAEGITEHELAVAAGYLEGSLLLALEDSGSRMSRLGRGELSTTALLSVDEQVARIRAVTLDDVRAVVARVFGGERSLAAIGPFHADDLA
jgi:predicted Zn-dependent peptidase